MDLDLFTIKMHYQSEEALAFSDILHSCRGWRIYTHGPHLQQIPDCYLRNAYVHLNTSTGQCCLAPAHRGIVRVPNSDHNYTWAAMNPEVD